MALLWAKDYCVMYTAVIAVGVSGGMWHMVGCMWLVEVPWHIVPWSVGLLRGQGKWEGWLGRVAGSWGLGLL